MKIFSDTVRRNSKDGEPQSDTVSGKQDLKEHTVIKARQQATPLAAVRQNKNLRKPPQDSALSKYKEKNSKVVLLAYQKHVKKGKQTTTQLTETRKDEPERSTFEEIRNFKMPTVPALTAQSTSNLHELKAKLL